MLKKVRIKTEPLMIVSCEQANCSYTRPNSNYRSKNQNATKGLVNQKIVEQGRACRFSLI